MAYREEPDPKSKPEPVEPLVFCINCVNMCRNGFTNNEYSKHWKCLSPEVSRINPQTGGITSTTSCEEKNKKGYCKDYERKEEIKIIAKSWSWWQRLIAFLLP